MIKRILIVLALVISVLVPVTPAYAAYSRNVVIESGVLDDSAHWPVTPAVWYIGRYTWSISVKGTCASTDRCIRILQNSSIPAYGETYRYPQGNMNNCHSAVWCSLILVNGSALTTVWSFRRWILAHELGHAFGLGDDAYGTPSVMAPNGYQYVDLNPPFTTAELATLQRTDQF